MNDDDRLSRYLANGAEGIPLTPADPGSVMRRGARRRSRRRGALVGTMAVLALLATTVAVRDGNDQRVEVDLAAPHVSASTYDWSVVRPTTGLGYQRSQATLADGTLYGLSTAPGPYDEARAGDPATLYRSTDGAEWAQVALPADLHPSSLSSSGEVLYALGTATAGGGSRELVLATSRDGADTWSTVRLPRDIADLDARHPGQLVVYAPEVAALDATHLVATVVVSANLDPARYGIDLEGGELAWEWTEEGLTIYDPPTPCGDAGGQGCQDPEPEAARSGDAADAPMTVRETHTYDELGVDPELRDLVRGRTFAYVSDDGATFTRSELPGDVSGWGSKVLATPDGYRLVIDRWAEEGSTATVLRSADGHTWTVDTVLDGSTMTAGLLGDQLAVVLYPTSGGPGLLKVQHADGTWSDLHLADVLSVPEGHEPYVGSVAFGPLGLAAIVGSWAEDADDASATPTEHLVHSSDGRTLSVLAVHEVAGVVGSPVGVHVGADAITVRLHDGVDGDPGTPPTQVVLVGTPTG